MQEFKHVNAKTFEEASRELADGRKVDNLAMAGGTDLMTELRTRIQPVYPDKIVNLKSIEGAEYIEGDETVKIGALTKLKDVEASGKLPAVLREAAHSVASPLVRNKATIGGNICQDVRCWFYRYPEGSGGALNCARKGGAECFALKGDSRFHSIFGGMKVASPVGCSGGCPNNTDIGAYMEKLRAGDWAAAAEIFYRVNPMPTITSRVCAHLCENHCNRMTVMATEDIKDADDCVSIHTVERALGDYAMQHKDVYYKAPEKETGVNIAVVGAGPAGLTAAYYLRKAGHSVTVYDKMEKAGGMLQYAIPNYRLPKHYVDEVAAAIEGMGVHFEYGKELGRDFDAECLEKRFDKVFYATGAWKRPVLGFDGEEFTEFGLEFLVEVNKWMNKKKRENVIVIGGGNVAMDVTRSSIRLGAKQVSCVYGRRAEDMTAQEEEVQGAVAEGAELLTLQAPIRIEADENGNAVALWTQPQMLGRMDERGKPKISAASLPERRIEADMIIVAIGQGIESDAFDQSGIKITRGRIAAQDSSQLDENSNVFAGGDCVTGPASAIRAIAAGKVAAANIDEYLGFHHEITTDDEIPNPRFNNKPPHGRVSSAEREASERKHDFVCIECGMTKEQAMQETSRCLRCDHFGYGNFRGGRNRAW